jgi:uncharacterized protein (TIGR03437 family)
MAISPDGRFLYASGARQLFGQQPEDYIVGVRQEVLRLNLSRIGAGGSVAPGCLAHGATYASSPSSPGAIMTIYGSNLGPALGSAFTVRDGGVPKELAGTRVTVDGVPSPVLYAQDSQLNFVVPWSAKTSGAVHICVSRADQTSCFDATADTLAPASFWLGQGYVLNQNGSFNSEQNRVPRGGYITLYLTGTGTLAGPLVDGAVSVLPLQRSTATITATIDGDLDPPCRRIFGGPCPLPPQLPVEVTYAGSAPALVSGVTQINVRIPESVPGGSRFLRFAFAPSSRGTPVTALVYVAP